MPRYSVVPVVEGYGEVGAVPVLIRRWLEFRRYRNVDVHIAGPVRAPGRGALTASHDPTRRRGIEHFVRIAVQSGSDAILVLLDADEDCPRELGSALLDRARAVLPEGLPVAVVVANREYEAWFLVALRSSAFRKGLVDAGLCATSPTARVEDAESIADCKKVVAETILGTAYRETVHQQRLTQLLPFSKVVATHSRSFRKLLKELDALLQAARARRSV